MKTLNVVLKVVLCLLLVSPILGSFGVFPPPTPDLYNTPEAFAFIDTLMQSGYVTWMISIVFAIVLVLVVMGRTAFAAVLLAPITVNIIGFHLFLDGGLFTSGAVMANVLFLLNVYFLWRCREQYKPLLARS